MARNSRLAYVQARLQARYGHRLEEERWRLLEASADLGNYLQAARATPLKPWVLHLTPDSGVHRMERSLRADWKAYVAEIAAWLPGEWGPALAWVGRIVELPAVTHLVRRGPVPAWTRDDPAFSDLAVEDWPTREAAIMTSDYADVAMDIAAGSPPEAAWLAGLIRRCPEPPEGLEMLARSLTPSPLPQGEGRRRTLTPSARPRRGGPSSPSPRGGERAGVRGADHEAATHEDPLAPARAAESMDAWRERMMAVMLSAFRRHAGGMGAVFAFLGLAALDFHRLRAGLVTRAAFPDPSRRPQWA